MKLSEAQPSENVPPHSRSSATTATPAAPDDVDPEKSPLTAPPPGVALATDQMKLTVQMITGSFEVVVTDFRSMTVLELQHAIHAEHTDMPPDAQRLLPHNLSSAAPMEDGAKTLASFDLKPGSVVHLSIQDEAAGRARREARERAANKKAAANGLYRGAVSTARPVVRTVSRTRVPVVVCECLPSANDIGKCAGAFCTALLTATLYLIFGLVAMVVAFGMSSLVGLFGMDLGGSAAGWVTFLFNLLLLSCTGLGGCICAVDCENGRTFREACNPFFFTGMLIMLFSTVMCWVITYDVIEYHSLSGAPVGNLSPVNASDAVNPDTDFVDVTFQPHTYIDISLGVAVIDAGDGSLFGDGMFSRGSTWVKYCMAPVVSSCGAESHPSWETCDATTSHCLGLGQSPPECRAQGFPGLDTHTVDIHSGTGSSDMLQGYSCMDTDWPATDVCHKTGGDSDSGYYCIEGNIGCEWYDDNVQHCGEYDAGDVFVASRMCCACGGGGLAKRTALTAPALFWVAINVEEDLPEFESPSSTDLEHWNLGSSNLDICRTAWLQYVLALNTEVQDQNDRVFPLAKNEMAPLTSEIFTAANQRLISAYPGWEFGSLGTASGDAEIQERLAVAFSKGPVTLPAGMSPTFMMFQP
jgi:hypothetical protein